MCSSHRCPLGAGFKGGPLLGAPSQFCPHNLYSSLCLMKHGEGVGSSRVKDGVTC